MTHCINYKFMYLSAYWLWKWANNRNKISAALQIMLRARLDNQQNTVSPRIDHQSWTFAKKKFCFDLFARHWLLPQTLHTYTSCLYLVRNGALQIFYSRSEIVRRLVMPRELILGFFLHHICSRQIFCLSSCVKVKIDWYFNKCHGVWTPPYSIAHINDRYSMKALSGNRSSS